jgi:hypothetical protein
MHLTPGFPTMTIAKVEELAKEMAKSPTPVVLSFTQEQIMDLLAEINLRTRPGSAAQPVAAVAAPVERSPVKDYAAHRKTCDQCTKGAEGRCATGQALYTAACATVMDEVRVLL